MPTERHKTLTGLVNTEPLVGAQSPRAQKLQWFLSESTWDERKVEAKRLSLLQEDPSTAPTERGVLVAIAPTSCSTGLSGGMPSLSTVLLDPKSTNYR